MNLKRLVPSWLRKDMARPFAPAAVAPSAPPKGPAQLAQFFREQDAGALERAKLTVIQSILKAQTPKQFDDALKYGQQSSSLLVEMENKLPEFEAACASLKPR